MANFKFAMTNFKFAFLLLILLAAPVAALAQQPIETVPAPAANGWQTAPPPAQYLPPPSVGGNPTAAPTPQAPASLTPAPALPSTNPVAAPSTMTPVMNTPGVPIGPAAGRRVRAFARSDVPVQFKWYPDTTGNRWIATIDSGVNIIIDVNESAPVVGQVGQIDIAADRMVIWTSNPTQPPDYSNGALQDQREPLELYMEGNIEFRQGPRTVRAERMYFDVPNNVGKILNADLLTPVPKYEGLLRLHANVLQMTAKDKYYGKDVFITSSRMGLPTYRFQAGDLYFEDITKPLTDPLSGLPLIDPETGQQIEDRQQLATASNNFVYLGPVPIFYWPVMSTDLKDPTLYIKRARLRQDNVYGTQILADFDGYQLLGLRNKPKGTDFDISLDYLNKRGFGYGATFVYGKQNIPGDPAGLGDFWGLQDHGVDNLGEGRRAVPLEESYRYRLFWQHRQQHLPYDFQLSVEAGKISDRNFLEEFYKREWEELKDETTGIELKRLDANTALSFSADVRVNDFFTQSDWLPRADHFWIGQPLLNDVFTWYEHSNIAYGQFQRTTRPPNTDVGAIVNPAGPFNYLPWEVDSRQGERLVTRQEIDWPLQLGAVKVVPYALGEAAHWGQDVNGDSLDRLFWQGGVRASMPMWSADPTVCSELFNVHGIAHKIVFDAEFSFAQSNRNLDLLPLYDPLDDDSVEAFRRRFLTTTFGLPSNMLVPTGTPYIPAFDERLYALRYGMQNWVTSPSTEIADDLTAVRLGVDQRWQTKRGPAHDRRIIDWITLDTNISLFPDPNRDNFGTTAGLLDYDFRWHVGDRLTLVSDAVFDFFNQGQKIISVGGFLSRPPRGSLYVGFRIIEGPTNLNSQVLSLSYDYWMSPKWVSSFGTSIDFGSQGNIGQNFSVTRVGESFLISAGVMVDAARNNVGAMLSIEPRFLPKNRLGNVGGAQIPPAGAFGLE
jgi:hypothetical protein